MAVDVMVHNRCICYFNGWLVLLFLAVNDEKQKTWWAAEVNDFYTHHMM